MLSLTYTGSIVVPGSLDSVRRVVDPSWNLLALVFIFLYLLSYCIILFKRVDLPLLVFPITYIDYLAALSCLLVSFIFSIFFSNLSTFIPVLALIR